MGRKIVKSCAGMGGVVVADGLIATKHLVELVELNVFGAPHV